MLEKVAQSEKLDYNQLVQLEEVQNFQRKLVLAELVHPTEPPSGEGTKFSIFPVRSWDLLNLFFTFSNAFELLKTNQWYFWKLENLESRFSFT